MTLMSGRSPSRVPLSIVTVRKSGEAADPVHLRALLLRGHFGGRQLALEGVVFTLEIAKADVAGPDALRARHARRYAALNFREQAEGHGLEHGHALAGIDLRRNQQDVSERHAQEKVARSLLKVEQCHLID
jgi:hypothetical protein